MMHFLRRSIPLLLSSLVVLLRTYGVAACTPPRYEGIVITGLKFVGNPKSPKLESLMTMMDPDPVPGSATRTFISKEGAVSKAITTMKEVKVTPNRFATVGYKLDVTGKNKFVVSKRKPGGGTVKKSFIMKDYSGGKNGDYSYFVDPKLKRLYVFYNLDRSTDVSAVVVNLTNGKIVNAQKFQLMMQIKNGRQPTTYRKYKKAYLPGTSTACISAYYVSYTKYSVKITYPASGVTALKVEPPSGKRKKARLTLYEATNHSRSGEKGLKVKAYSLQKINLRTGKEESSMLLDGNDIHDIFNKC